jgi:hypothetical protein
MRRYILFLAGLSFVLPTFATPLYIDANGGDTAALENLKPRFQELFGSALPESIRIERWDKSWSNADHPNNRIQLSANASPLKCIVAHETSHLAMANLAEGANAWDDRERFAFVDEGFAMVMENEACEYSWAGQRTASKTLGLMKRKNVSLDAMQRWTSFFGPASGENADWAAYQAAASFAYYMIDTFGLEKTFLFYKSLKDTRAIDSSFKQVFDKERSDVEKDWLAWISTKSEGVEWSDKPHFYSPDGTALPRIEIAYDGLWGYFGASTPPRITIENAQLLEPGVPQVDVTRRWIGVPIAADGNIDCNAVGGSMQIAAAAVSGGVSDQEDFKFLTVGMSKIFETEICGGGRKGYRERAMSAAKEQAIAGQVSFENIQKWSSYLPGGSGRFVAASFAYFVMSRHGKAGMVSLIKSVGETRDLSRSIEVVFGKDLATTEQEWIAFISQPS